MINTLKGQYIVGRCPRCLSHKLSFNHPNNTGEEWDVKCTSCGAETEWNVNKFNAIEEWNNGEIIEEWKND